MLSIQLLVLNCKKKVAEENGEYKDSTYYGYRTFATTREVIQANQLENDKVAIQNCINKSEWTYLKVQLESLLS